MAEDVIAKDNVVKEPKYDYSGGCHDSIIKEYTIKKGEGKYPDHIGSFTIAGLMTGCGAAQVKGIAGITADSFESFKNSFNEVIPQCKKSGIGIIIGTLGQSYYYIEPLLFQLGFTLKEEYHNWRHGTSYMQRMYHYVIK